MSLSLLSFNNASSLLSCSIVCSYWLTWNSKHKDETLKKTDWRISHVKTGQHIEKRSPFLHIIISKNPMLAFPTVIHSVQCWLKKKCYIEQKNLHHLCISVCFLPVHWTSFDTLRIHETTERQNIF
jgi:hypothetical protein